MKQTAVEWLFQELDNYYQMKGNVIKKEILKQAKEMQKEQIENAYFDSTSQFSVDARMDYPKSAEQYYNETFNK